MQLNSSSNTRSIPGFTLVELIVSTALFVSVITIAVGALFTAQNVNSRLQATHIILDGMSLSFELMSREIRYGSVLYCGSNTLPFPLTSVLYRTSCKFDATDVVGSPGGTTLVFRPVDAVLANDRIGFYLSNGKIYKWEYTSGIVGPARQITSDDIVVDSMRFFVTGANTTAQAISNGNIENGSAGVTDVFQPVVTVLITGSITSKASDNRQGQKIKFQLQTTVTPRGLDI